MSSSREILLLNCLNFSFAFFIGFGTSSQMYFDTTLQEALSRGLKCRSNDLSKSVKFVRLITKYLQEDYNNIFYGKAQNLGRVLCKAYDEALQKYDVLILPTLPKKASVFPKENPPLDGLDFLHLIAVTNNWKFAAIGAISLSTDLLFCLEFVPRERTIRLSDAWKTSYSSVQQMPSQLYHGESVHRNSQGEKIFSFDWIPSGLLVD